MTILCTFPGRAGDLIWALPTIRALSRRLQQPLDLAIAGEFAGLRLLLERQDYLRAVHPIPTWGMAQGWEPPPLRSPDVVDPYDQIFHLGYRRWPELALPYETCQTLNQHGQTPYIALQELDLETPWITVPFIRPSTPWLCGFSECHFELKYGLWELLTTHPRDAAARQPYSWEGLPLGQGPLSICVGGRWRREAGHTGSDWLEGAQWLAATQVFLGDCSGWHVLAVAMGIPVIMYEPMEARWNPIFYPLGWDGPQVTRVTGNDGEWTTDARHTAELIQQKLTELQRG